MAGNLVLAGRVKDTIVLSNGENVEPQPIEDACSQSDYIQFIVLYGQDRRALGALICKNEDAFEELEKTQGEACNFHCYSVHMRHIPDAPCYTFSSVYQHLAMLSWGQLAKGFGTLMMGHRSCNLLPCCQPLHVSCSFGYETASIRQGL